MTRTKTRLDVDVLDGETSLSFGLGRGGHRARLFAVTARPWTDMHIIRRHRELITIAESHEIHDEGRLDGAAARCVRDVGLEHARDLRSLLARRHHGLDRWTDHQLVEYLAREVGMLCGRYAVSRRSIAAFGAPAVRQGRQPEPDAEPATRWIEFQVQNDSGAALANVRISRDRDRQDRRIVITQIASS